MKQTYGVDVAITRADDLDKKMLVHMESKENARVLDLGSGAGGQSLRLVQAGARVTAVDVEDYTEAFQEIRQTHDLAESDLRFIRGSVLELPTFVGGEVFADCCMQRVLHYLKYEDALQLLRYVKTITSGRLYIAVSGLDSEIGRTYADRNKPIVERFCTLESDEAKTFFIHEPVCLYRQEEFETLLSDAGWQIEECWVSAFGNIKAVCS